MSISKHLKQVCISLGKDFPIILLLPHAKDETLEFLAHHEKASQASLGFIKSSETPSAEERKNVCCLSTQKVLIVDSTWTYSAVVASYLFPQVCKLPLLVEASQVNKEQPPISISRKHPIYLISRNSL